MVGGAVTTGAGSVGGGAGAVVVVVVGGTVVVVVAGIVDVEVVVLVELVATGFGGPAVVDTRVGSEPQAASRRTDETRRIRYRMMRWSIKQVRNVVTQPSQKGG